MTLTRFLIFLALVGHSAGAQSQGFLRADGKRIINDGGEVILKGIGLGGWMLQEPYMLKLSGAVSTQHDIRAKLNSLIGQENTNQFYSAWLANHCTKGDIDSLAAWGYNSVRLPMHYNLFTPPIEEEKDGANTWIETGFTLTDSLLSWCKSNHIYLILDLHAAPGGQGNDNAISDRDTSKPSLWQSERNRDKTVALWRKLATRYASEEWIGGYDILNEPNWGFQTAADKNGCAETGNIPLKKLYQDITSAIRKVDKKHIIIIEGNCWGNNYNGIFPLWDNNLTLSFHKYWNLNDLASIQKMLDYREKYNVPIWLGETGENSNAWFTDAIRLVETNNIGWNMWPLKKAGINNPLEIRITPGYQDIINFWSGTGTKPAAGAAFRSMMEFAANTNIRSNTTQRGVIDAMIRQVKTNVVLPYKPNAVVVGTRIFSTDYDLGRSGTAWHDADSANYWVSTTKHTSWNEGGEYRNDGVDIERCGDSITNGYNVAWIRDGEWLQYSVYSKTASRYTVGLRYSADSLTAGIRMQLNAGNPSPVKRLSPTGSYTKWRTEIVGDLTLVPGWNRIKVIASEGGLKTNYLQFITSNN